MALIAVDHARDRKTICSKLLLGSEMIPPLRRVKDLSLRTGNCGVRPPKPRKNYAMMQKTGRDNPTCCLGPTISWRNLIGTRPKKGLYHDSYALCFSAAIRQWHPFEAERPPSKTKSYGFKANNATNACTLPARAAQLHILRIHQLGNDI
jgi:hypothetical protein